MKVQWVDSVGNGRWSPLEDLAELTKIDCVTVGHLLNRTADVVRVVGTMGDQDQAIHTIVIPKSSITSIIRLVEETCP